MVYLSRVEWSAHDVAQLRVPNFAHLGGMNDRFAIGRASAVLKYARVYFDAVAEAQDGDLLGDLGPNPSEARRSPTARAAPPDCSPKRKMRRPW